MVGSVAVSLYIGGDPFGPEVRYQQGSINAIILMLLITNHGILLLYCTVLYWRALYYCTVVLLHLLVCTNLIKSVNEGWWMIDDG